MAGLLPEVTYQVNSKIARKNSKKEKCILNRGYSRGMNKVFYVYKNLRVDLNLVNLNSLMGSYVVADQH